MQLLLATTNKGKVIEISEALDGLGLDILSLLNFNFDSSAPETGDTYEANALEKALWAHEKTGLPSLADDSGIIIDALSGELGVHTRRWGAGPEATDQEWIDYFLNRMKDEPNKSARFVCCLAYVDAEEGQIVFEGTCEGIITRELEANYLPGLPLSACFRPDGYEKVFSALSTEQKNAVSHRGRAVKQFYQFLTK